jgi:hypothetical protein
MTAAPGLVQDAPAERARKLLNARWRPWSFTHDGNELCGEVIAARPDSASGPVLVVSISGTGNLVALNPDAGLRPMLRDSWPLVRDGIAIRREVHRPAPEREPWSTYDVEVVKPDVTRRTPLTEKASTTRVRRILEERA